MWIPFDAKIVEVNGVGWGSHSVEVCCCFGTGLFSSLIGPPLIVFGGTAGNWSSDRSDPSY